MNVVATLTSQLDWSPAISWIRRRRKSIGRWRQNSGAPGGKRLFRPLESSEAAGFSKNFWSCHFFAVSLKKSPMVTSNNFRSAKDLTLKDSFIFLRSLTVRRRGRNLKQRTTSNFYTQCCGFRSRSTKLPIDTCHRQALRTFCQSGQVDELYQLLEQWFPNFQWWWPKMTASRRLATHSKKGIFAINIQNKQLIDLYHRDKQHISCTHPRRRGNIERGVR